ncbi:MAG: response regulator transcription factor [Chloroflexota bacterium]|nr:response regulator transcription factor [Chloroflexota bacterium]
MAGERVLIIEDELTVARAVRISLEGYGFVVDTATSGAAGYARALQPPLPQLILLDLGLPDMDGLTVCSRLREQSLVPIIVLTARDAEYEKIIALEGGADDYVTKPFGMGELLARIRVALRHAQPAAHAAPAAPLVIGDLTLDPAAHQVRVRGTAIHLTPTEFKLLQTLAANAGRVSTHRALLRDVWGSGYGADTQILRVFIAQLRTKLEGNPAEPEYILTEPGVGYRFRAPDEA